MPEAVTIEGDERAYSRGLGDGVSRDSPFYSTSMTRRLTMARAEAPGNVAQTLTS